MELLSSYKQSSRATLSTRQSSLMAETAGKSEHRLQAVNQLSRRYKIAFVVISAVVVVSVGVTLVGVLAFKLTPLTVFTRGMFILLTITLYRPKHFPNVN